MKNLFSIPCDSSTRDDMRRELLRMEYGHGGMKRGRFVYRCGGNDFRLDSMTSNPVDLWAVLNAIFPAQ